MTLLRSLLFNLFFFATTFALALYGAPLRRIAPTRAAGLVRFWARLELAGARTICGIRYAVSGLEHVPGGAALLASQHQSTFDTLVWFLLLPNCSYVAKRELTRIPLFGALMRPAGLIVVDRAGGGAALRALVRDARRVAAEGRQIVIFPEGSRAEPGRPLPVQPGIAALAAATRLPVIPVLTDSGRCWGRRAFRKRAGTITIRVLPPLPPDLPREALTERLENLYRGDPRTVDKIVDQPRPAFRSDRSLEPEPIE
jgi:1-acyl-sn-glycerol-3-phosphate acyltransferase